MFYKNFFSHTQCLINDWNSKLKVSTIKLCVHAHNKNIPFNKNIIFIIYV